MKVLNSYELQDKGSVMKTIVRTKKEKVTWKEFFQVVMAIAFPIAIQNLLGTTASMVDTIMIGSQGELAVAAVGICSQISSLYFNCYWGFASGSVLFFSQYWGARDEEGINRTLGISLLFMSIVAVLFSTICIFFPEFMLGIYTDKQNIIVLGIPYLRIVGFSYLIQVVIVIVSTLMRSTERIRQPLIGSVAAIIVNFVLNWILIYGRFGMPQMGAAGAAVGTLVSSIVNLGILFIYLYRTNGCVKLRREWIFRLNGVFVKGYLLKCFPIICNELLYGVGQMLINIVIGHQNESAIAAMAAFRVCEGFVYAFFGGLASATGVVVGKKVGGGELYKAHAYAKYSALVCPMVTFLIVLIGTIVNRPLFTLFGLGETALQYGKYMMLIYLFFGTVRTCNYIMNESFRAGGEAVFGTVVEIICLYAISVPATWLAGMIWNLPFLLVFSFVYTDEIIRLVILGRYMIQGKWIKPVTSQGKAALEEFFG